MPHFLWPKSNLLLGLAALLMMVGIIFNFVANIAEKPPYEPDKHTRELGRCVMVWQTCEWLALAVLTFTEVGAIATFNDPHPDQWFDILVVCLLFFGPYAALSLLARNRLRRCYEILAEEIQNQREPARPS